MHEHKVSRNHLINRLIELIEEFGNKNTLRVYDLNLPVQTQELYAFAILMYIKDCFNGIKIGGINDLVLLILSRSLFEAVIIGINQINDGNFYKRIIFDGRVFKLEQGEFLLKNSEAYLNESKLRRIKQETSNDRKMIEILKLNGQKGVQKFDQLVKNASEFIKSPVIQDWYSLYYRPLSNEGTHPKDAALCHYLSLNPKGDSASLKRRGVEFSIDILYIDILLLLIYLDELNKKYNLGLDDKIEEVKKYADSAA